MTNYGAGYILAAMPRRRSARQLSALIALETFGCDREGWRSVSQAKLADFANLDLKTLRRARDELIEADRLPARPRQGRSQPLQDPRPAA